MRGLVEVNGCGKVSPNPVVVAGPLADQTEIRGTTDLIGGELAMLSITELKPGQSIVGLEPTAVGTVVAVVPIAANAVGVIYTTRDGALKARLLNPADEPGIGLATADRPWSFDGDGAAFQLTCEA